MTMSSIAEKILALGPRPDENEVRQAREALAMIEESRMSSNLDEKEIEATEMPHRTILWLHQLYESYEIMLKNMQDPRQDRHDGNMSGMQLTRLTNDPSRFSSLVVLDLSKNNLQVLPDFFNDLGQLKVLNLSGNALRSMPQSLGCCSLLVELDASFNKLEVLPKNFGANLPNMERLYLQLNKLRLLPAGLCDMNSLVHLEVHFNNLMALPGSIGNLTKLKFLNVSGNFSNLTRLPDSIGNATCLEFLDLSYNQITRLPLSFGNLLRLKELKLLQNPLVFPPKVVADHSTKAVLEYMGDQLSRMHLQQDEEDNDGFSYSNRGFMVPCSPRLFLRPSTWIGDLLGGMCRSTSLVLGGSSATKFVGLRSSSSD